MANFNDGPYLNGAFLCEKVLQEKDETISIVRIVDRITITAAASSAPISLPPTNLSLSAFISLKSGNARGSHTIKLILEEPSGIRKSEQLLPALFEGEDRGVNLIVNLNVLITQEGVYWFNIFLEEEFLTRIPLRVLYQRIGSQSL
jgi:hypothetical protein